jgi:hypothetical protein
MNVDDELALEPSRTGAQWTTEVAFSVAAALALSGVRSAVLVGLAVLGVSASLRYGLVGAALTGIAGSLLLVEAPWQAVLAAACAYLLITSEDKRPMFAWRSLRWMGVGITAGTTSGRPIVGQLPLVLVLLAAPLVAVVNGAAEELVWRHLAWAGEKRNWSYVASALSFAAAHFSSGFPSGAVGVILSLVFGVVAAEVKRRWGLATAIWMHCGADLPIVVYLINR